MMAAYHLYDYVLLTCKLLCHFLVYIFINIAKFHCFVHSHTEPLNHCTEYENTKKFQLCIEAMEERFIENIPHIPFIMYSHAE